MEDTNIVSVDTLKEQGFTDEELQGIITEPEPTPEPQPEPEPSPEPSPEPEPEPTPEPVDEPAPDRDSVSKHVPYDRFKEVNEKNKVLAAELAALKAQQQTQQPQANQPIQQPQTTPQQPDMYAKIKSYAKQEAIKRLNIEGNPQDLMFTDPDKYEEYLEERSAITINTTNIYNENLDFANELKAQPDFQVLYQFASAELDEMPAKQAREIEQSFARINQGFGSRKDMAIAQKYVDQCREKMNSISAQQAPAQGAFSMPNNQPATNPLDKAAGLPKAQNLSGAKTSAMSWAQANQLINEGRGDEVPSDMLAQIPTGRKLLGLE